MARKSERQTLLESGEARGILKPEHLAELQALRAKTGVPATAKAAPKPADINALKDAGTRSRAAGDSIRLYNEIAPVIDRFNPGPTKGAIYDAVMPNEGGGVMDSIGSFVGAPLRALLPAQDKDDYQRINSARSERIALRQMEQKGPQTDKDAAMYGRADISTGKSRDVNRSLIRSNAEKSGLVKVQAALESKWVGRYGSISQLSSGGKSFEEALSIAERDFLAAQARRKAPPSTRRASSGWSATEVK